MKTYNCGSGKIYSFPMTDIEYIGYFYGKSGNEYVKSAYTRLKQFRGTSPDFVFNAELFDFKTRKAVSDVVSGGTVHKLGENYGIAFPNNKTAVFSYKNNVKAKDYVGAYPVLIKGGKIESSIPSGLGGSRGRTAIGVGGGNFYAALIPDGSNGVTLTTLRNYMKSAGATDAINLDGGGSTQFYAPNGNFFTSRPVRGFIAIWLKKPNTPTSTPTEVQKADVRTVKVRTSLNVRLGAGTLSKRVGKLYNGNKVTVLEEKNGWARIENGWVSSKYLVK